MPRRLRFRFSQSPGDTTVGTASVRDLHLAYPGQFETDVEGTAMELWENNPYITRFTPGDPGVEMIEMHCDSIHQSNQRPYHFITSFAEYLEGRLGLRIPITQFKGDIHLSAVEKAELPRLGVELPAQFWIMVAGGKYDFTAKWWNPDCYQEIVDYFSGRIVFLQCGEAGHWHPPLNGVINLVGKTNTREFVRLMYFAAGVVCPVTFAMHLSPAVETPPGRPKNRPCVVIAGAREPIHWEAYPFHQHISTNGMLDCCQNGGCWKSRCQLAGDGDPKDGHDVCVHPVDLKPGLHIARCMHMITAKDVIRRIEMYLEGGLASLNGSTEGQEETQPSKQEMPPWAAKVFRAVHEARNRATNETEMQTGTAIAESEEPVTLANVATEDAPPADSVESAAHHHTNGAVIDPPADVVDPDASRDRQANEPRQPNPLFDERSKLPPTTLAFHHGFGDSVYFSHLIPLYVRRGYRIEVECTPDKAILFEAAGATTIRGGAVHQHGWNYPSGGTHPGHGRFWQGSKIAHNISEPPLPNIGEKTELWDEFVASRVDLLSRIPKSTFDTVDRWLERLERPIVLFHSRGNTGQERKSLPNETTAAVYREFINRCDGTLITLDWDNRVPRVASGRLRHLTDLGACSTETLIVLMAKADLMIGVDSGPLHASRYTTTPTIGLWMPGHYPTTYSLPRREQLNVVLAGHTQAWNRFKRIPWNIVEHPGTAFTAERIADLCGQMLSEPRYLARADIAADVQLQYFVRELCRWNGGASGLAGFWDRNRSLDIVLRELSARFPNGPQVVETGTIRAEEDWSGAGFSTYLFGAYVSRRSGRLDSVDFDPANVTFARNWTDVFGDTVRIHEGDSLAFLNRFHKPVDLMYFDSRDTTEPNHAEHAFHELESALPKLHERSLIVFDDTPWNAGSFTGKGARAVPWLLENHWQILYAGYQVVLSRTPKTARD